MENDNQATLNAQINSKRLSFMWFLRIGAYTTIKSDLHVFTVYSFCMNKKNENVCKTEIWLPNVSCQQ